jgi:opacity protein-like surface antigen
MKRTLLAMACALAASSAASAVVFTASFLSTELEPDKQIAGWNHRIVRFKWDGTTRSAVLFGAGPNVGASDVGYGEYTVHSEGDGTGSVPAERPEWIVHSGYAAMRGWFPIIRTSVVRAVSDSTTIIVERDALGGMDRVYLWEGTSAAVEVLKGEKQTIALSQGEFVEVKSSGKDVGKTRKASFQEDARARDFVAQVVGQKKYEEVVRDVIYP